MGRRGIPAHPFLPVRLPCLMTSAHEAIIYDKHGEEVAKVIYSSEQTSVLWG